MKSFIHSYIKKYVPAIFPCLLVVTVCCLCFFPFKMIVLVVFLCFFPCGELILPSFLLFIFSHTQSKYRAISKELLQILLLLLITVLSENVTDGEVQLVGSNFTFEGRVEIYHNKEWGTICDDGWGVEESNVVCHQLGYMKGAQYWYSNAKFKKGHGKIWLDDVSCYGNESALTECRNIGWNGHNCRHYEDVGVVCLPKGECTSLSSMNK